MIYFAVFTTAFEVLLLVYKALNGMVPSYLADMVRLRQGNRYSLRADTELLLQGPTTRRSFGDRAFFTAGPTLWNRLPQSIRAADNLPSFKSLLKTHLFLNATAILLRKAPLNRDFFSLTMSDLWRYISNSID
jgi:hypothetical protein